MSKQTAIHSDEGKSDDDDFHKLMFRFTAANERLALAAHALARAEVPPAAIR